MFGSTWCIVVLTTLLGLIINSANGQPGKSCTTPTGEQARCISIYSCPVLYDVVTDKSPETLRFLKESQCGYDIDPFVCCGTSAGYQTRASVGNRPTRRGQGSGGQGRNFLPNRNSCGFQDSDRILGGITTQYNEFPWMALLQYRKNSGGMTFSCGGALISNRYVLTAAHCLTGQITQKVGPLASVRLGEWNTDTAQDCDTVDGFQDCNDPPMDVGIEDIIAHSDYDDNSRDRYHDIGLIRLDREVQFTSFIKPICLPSSSERAAVGDKLWVAGWGRTEYANFSPTKLKVGVPIVENQQCRSTFRTAGVTVADSQICAGGERNKDSCNGDSGGPLMYETKTDPKQWRVEGVVSFGTRCGTQNWPGIYTRVSKYINWIYNNVRR